jgi:cytochrome c oxidase subunit 2
MSAGCGSCHVVAEAGTTGMTGPNLDESLQGKDAEYIRESILNPDAQVAEGFQPGLMPKDYDQRLSDQQLADLVAFLAPS